MNFYTNVFRKGNHILFRGYENNKAYVRKLEYKPDLYISSSNPRAPYKSLDGQPLDVLRPGTIKETQDFIEQYKGVKNFNYFGMENWIFSFINQEFNDGKPLKYDDSLIRIANIDIEVKSDNGFPEPDRATEEIISITCHDSKDKIYHVFGLGDYKPHREDVRYTRHKDEKDLVIHFIEWFRSKGFDVITGWNTEGFDIPYMVNRFKRLDIDPASLSPYRSIQQKEHLRRGKEIKTYLLHGLASLDYMHIYLKFNLKLPESWALNYIAHVELGEKKLDYSEYGSLRELYKHDYQKFIEYNIRDVELVNMIENKKRFLQVVFNLAYYARVNYEDVLKQTKMWDSIIYNYLKPKGIIIPKRSFSEAKTEKYKGAYVKDPKAGLYKWIINFDLKSLYPHLFMWGNVGPDTYKGKIANFPIECALENNIPPGITSMISKNNYALTGNGTYYLRDKKGFLADILETLYEERASYKTKATELKKLPNQTKEIKDEIARLNLLQEVKKVCLNSSYGAIGNEGFRFYNLDQAESITYSAQLAIRWIANKFNIFLNKSLNSKDYEYVFYSDTDSCYITLDNLVKKSGLKDNKKIVKFLDKFAKEVLQPYIQKSYHELGVMMNAYQPDKLQMAREYIANKGLWTDVKKRYILNVMDDNGLVHKVPQLKVTGFESVRSSTPEVFRKSLKNSFKIIMNKDEVFLRKYASALRKRLLSGTKINIEDIAMSTSVSDIKKFESKDGKGLFKKGAPAHCKGAITYNHLLKEKKLLQKYQLLNDGDKMKLIQLKTPNPLELPTIGIVNVLPKEFGLHKYVDTEAIYEKFYAAPLQKLLDVVGWKINDKEESISLEELFGA